MASVIPSSSSSTTFHKKKASEILYFIIWRRIATFLTDSDVYSLAKVSIDLLDACDSDIIWKAIADEAEQIAILQQCPIPLPNGNIAPFSRQRMPYRNNRLCKLVKMNETDIDRSEKDAAIHTDLVGYLDGIKSNNKEICIVEPDSDEEHNDERSYFSSNNTNNNNAPPPTSTRRFIRNFGNSHTSGMKLGLENPVQLDTTSRLKSFIADFKNVLFVDDSSPEGAEKCFTAAIGSSLPLQCDEFRRYFSYRMFLLSPETAYTVVDQTTKLSEFEKSSSLSRLSFHLSLLWVALCGNESTQEFPLWITRHQDSTISKLISSATNAMSNKQLMSPEEFLRLASWNKKFTEEDHQSQYLPSSVRNKLLTSRRDRDDSNSNNRRSRNNFDQRLVSNILFIQKGPPSRTLPDRFSLEHIFHLQEHFRLAKRNFDKAPFLFDPCVKLARQIQNHAVAFSPMSQSSEAISRVVKLVFLHVFSLCVVFGISVAEGTKYFVWPNYVEPIVSPITSATYGFLANLLSVPWNFVYDAIGALFSLSGDVVKIVGHQLLEMISGIPITPIVSLLGIIQSYFFSSSSNNSSSSNSTSTNSSATTSSSPSFWVDYFKNLPINQTTIYEQSSLYCLINWPLDFVRTLEEEEFYSSPEQHFTNQIVPFSTYSALFGIAIYAAQSEYSKWTKSRRQQNNNKRNSSMNSNKRQQLPPLRARFLLYKIAAETLFSTFMLLGFVPLEMCLYMPSSFSAVAVLPVWLANSSMYQQFTNVIWYLLLGENVGAKTFYMEAPTSHVMLTDMNYNNSSSSNSSTIDTTSSTMMTIARGGELRFNIAGIVLHQLVCWGVIAMADPLIRLLQYFDDSETYNNNHNWAHSIDAQQKFNNNTNDDDDNDDDSASDDSSYPPPNFGAQTYTPLSKWNPKFKDLSQRSKRKFLRKSLDESIRFPTNDDISREDNKLIFDLVAVDEKEIRAELLKGDLEQDGHQAQARIIKPTPTSTWDNFFLKFFATANREVRRHGKPFVASFAYNTGWFLTCFGIRFLMYRRGYSFWLSAVGSTVAVRGLGGVVNALWSLYEMGYF